MSYSWRPHGLQPTSLLCLWDFSGKTSGVGSHFLLQGLFPTQGLNLHLLHLQVGSLTLSHHGSPFLIHQLIKIQTQHLRFAQTWEKMLGLNRKQSDICEMREWARACWTPQERILEEERKAAQANSALNPGSEYLLRVRTAQPQDTCQGHSILTDASLSLHTAEM